MSFVFYQVQVFGFRSDGENKQKLYLFDEGQTIGQDGKHAHGPDAVISMIHHGIEQLTRGEDTCSFHADNCAGMGFFKLYSQYTPNIFHRINNHHGYLGMYAQISFKYYIKIQVLTS